MPTFFEILDDLKEELSRRRPDLDVSPGTVLHDLLATYSFALERLYNEVDTRVLLRSLDFAENFSNEELDKFAESFGVSRARGAHAFGSVTFRMRTIPDRPIFIPSGFKVSTPEGVVFETQASVTLSLGTLVFNTQTGFYEVTVPIRCLSEGTLGNVPANSITIPEYEIVGLSVINYAPTSGGTDSESNSSLIERVKTKLKGSNLGTKNGYLQLLRPYSAEIQVIGPREREMMRDEYGGCLDIYLRSVVEGSVEGETVVVTGDNINELSSQGYKLKFQPVVEIRRVTVTRQEDVYTPEFVLYRDYGLFSKSPKASDRVRLNFLLQVGDVISVDYSFNLTVNQVQEMLDRDENRIIGIDTLVRDFFICHVRLSEIAPSIKTTFEYRYRPLEVINSIKSAVSDFVNTKQAGSKLSLSDLVNVIENVEGVDYVVVENLLFEKRFEWESGFSKVEGETLELGRIFYFKTSPDLIGLTVV